MNPNRNSISIHLPEWFSDFIAAQGDTFPSPGARLIPALNFAHKTV